MKNALALALAVIMAFSLASVTTSAFADDALEGHLTVLSFTEYHDAVQATLDAFMEKNPGVTVDLEEYPFAQYSDAIEIKLGSASKDYDVLLTDITMVSNWAYQGWITPVDEYFTAEEKALFAPALVEAGTFESEFFSPPICNSCQAMFYNKDLLDAAGIPYPSENPEERYTWEEFADVGKTIVDKLGTDGVYAITFEQVDRPYQVLPIPNSAGGDVFAEDGLTSDGYLNSEAFVKGMQYYQDMHNEYGFAPKGVSASETVGLFTAGKVAFICSNIYNYKNFSSLDGFNFGYTPFPFFADGQPASPTGSWHVSVSNYSQNKELAVELVKFFSLEEGNDIFLASRGAFSAKLADLDKYATDPAYNEFPLSIFKLASYEAANTAYPRPVTVGYGIFEKIIESTFSDIRNGLNVQESLDSAVDQLNAQLSIYE